MNLPKHKFWGAGEPDCPPELKAPNGELHTMRCKVCGDGWRKSNTVCLVAGAAQIEAMVVEAMDEAWDDYVMDTNSFPDDFTLRGRSLGFKAGRWAHVVGQIVARRLAGNAGVTVALKTEDAGNGWKRQTAVVEGVTTTPADDLRRQAAKVCGYLGDAYDGEPRRVIEALVAALGVTGTFNTPGEKS